MEALALVEAFDKAAHAYADSCHHGDAELRDERLFQMNAAKMLLIAHLEAS